MNPGKNGQGDGWTEALARVFEAGSPRNGMLLFMEERQDAVVERGDRSESPDIDHSATSGLSARAPLAHGRLVYLADAEPDDVEPLVRSALDPTVSLPPRVFRSEGQARQDSLPVEAAVRFLDGLVEETRRRLGTGSSVRARFVGFRQHIRVGRSGQAVVEDRRESGRVRVEATLARGDRRAFAVAEAVLDPEQPGGEAQKQPLAEQVASRADARIGARRLSPGAYPVVFAPGVGGVLAHEIVGHALEADTVLEGNSWMWQGSAEPEPLVGSDELLVLDDPRRGRASWRFDDEGEPARPTPLLRRGRVVGLLHDLRSARCLTRPATGHGRRSSFREPVYPRMGCTFIAPGRFHPAEVFEGIAKGIYVRRMEAATIDTATGRAVFRVTDADEIRGGRLAAPLEAHLLHLEASQALPSIDRVATDLEFDACIGSCLHHAQSLSISVGAPTFRLGATRVQF